MYKKEHFVFAHSLENKKTIFYIFSFSGVEGIEMDFTYEDNVTLFIITCS